MADYSEFPTTPTGWQERQSQEWQTVTPLSTEDVAPPKRRVDSAPSSRAWCSSSWRSC